VKSTIGPATDTSATSPLGLLIASVMGKTSDVWDVAATAYIGTSRADAQGAQLDAIGALFGSRRLAATPSSVFCSCSFTAAGTYPAGSLVGYVAAQASQSAANAASVVVPAVHPANGLPVSVSNPFTTASTYAPPTLFAAPITGPNFGVALIAANATNPGNVGAFTGQVPVSGWASVVDVAGAVVGTLVETDTAYRLRQVEELGAQGSCNPSAITADVIEALQEAPVPVRALCSVLENVNDYVDANGQRPHSVQVVVYDGPQPNTTQNNPIIGQAIWNNKPSGIPLVGNTTVSIVDALGVTRTVPFSRAVLRPTYLVVNAQIASTANAAAVETAIVTAITTATQGGQFIAYGQTVQASGAQAFTPGTDVVPAVFGGIAQAQASVVQVTSVFAGFSPNPTSSAPLKIGPLQCAALASGSQGTGVVVNLSVFTP
jgi:hypothetical protein